MLQVTGKSVGDFLEVLIAPVYVPDIVIDTVEEAEKRDVKSQGSRVRVCSVDRYSKSVREAKLIRGSWIAPCTIAACKPHPLGLPFVCFLHLPKKLSGTIAPSKVKTCYNCFFLSYTFPGFHAIGIKFTSGCI